MSQSPRQLLTEALDMPSADRGRLAALLIESLESDAADGADEAWSDEINQRLQDIDAGRVRMIPWTEVRKRLRGQDAPAGCSSRTGCSERKMSIVVPHDVEEMVARQIANGRYRTDEEVLRSAMLALEEIDADYVAIQEAVDSWRRGEPGIPLAEAFRQVREAGPGVIQE